MSPRPSRAFEIAGGLSAVANYARDYGQLVSAVQRDLRVHVPTATLAALSLTNPYFSAPLPLGYELAATIGLSGEVSAGAASDALTHYHAPPQGRALVFNQVIAGLQELDQESPTGERLRAALERLWELVIRALAEEGDRLRKAGLLGVATFLLAVYTVVSQELSDDRQASQLLAIQGELTGVRGVVAGMRQDLSERARASEEADRHIRYVHKPTPLRLEPHRDGQLLRTVFPDQEIRVLEERGNWVKAEVYDYSTDAPMVGWINRGWLRVSPAS